MIKVSNNMKILIRTAFILNLITNNSEAGRLGFLERIIAEAPAILKPMSRVWIRPVQNTVSSSLPRSHVILGIPSILNNGSKHVPGTLIASDDEREKKRRQEENGGVYCELDDSDDSPECDGDSDGEGE